MLIKLLLRGITVKKNYKLLKDVKKIINDRNRKRKL